MEEHICKTAQKRVLIYAIYIYRNEWEIDNAIEKKSKNTWKDTLQKEIFKCLINIGFREMPIKNNLFF